MNAATTKMIEFSLAHWTGTDFPNTVDSLREYWECMVEDFPEAYDEDWYLLVGVPEVRATIDWDSIVEALKNSSEGSE